MTTGKRSAMPSVIRTDMRRKLRLPFVLVCCVLVWLAFTTTAIAHDMSQDSYSRRVESSADCTMEDLKARYSWQRIYILADIIFDLREVLGNQDSFQAVSSISRHPLAMSSLKTEILSATVAMLEIDLDRSQVGLIRTGD